MFVLILVNRLIFTGKIYKISNYKNSIFFSQIAMKNLKLFTFDFFEIGLIRIQKMRPR